MGKTHYVCATAERLCKKMNVYLLFGSRFSEEQDFEAQLYAMMGIGDNNLRKLNDKMLEEDSNALIIIDALNEGATELFWKREIKILEDLLHDCERIKLMLTYREGEGKYLTNSCETIDLRGFESNTDEAIQKYFDYYGIDDSDGKLRQRYLSEFGEPLFLSNYSAPIEVSPIGMSDHLTVLQQQELHCISNFRSS